MKNLLFLSQKKNFTFLLLMFNTACFGQMDDYKDSNEYYAKGNASYQEKDYKRALELYSLSLEKMPSSEAYYNRALTYFKLQDSCNYCSDFSKANEYGHIEAGKIYIKRCLIFDTIVADVDSIKEEYPGYRYTVISHKICTNDTSIDFYDAFNKPIKSIYDVFPEYIGGDKARMKFLMDNIRYPQFAMRRGIQGTVYLSFIVEKNGEVSNIKILKGIGGGCNDEAIRVVRMMPKWKPGTRKGIPVRVLFNMPLKFTLQ